MVKRVAKVKGAKGLKGDFYLLVFAKGFEVPLSTKSIELTNDSDSIEIKISSIKPHKKGYAVESSQLKKREDAEKLVGWYLYADESELLETEDPWTGYTIYEGESRVGQIEFVQDNGGQRLASLEGGQLVPLVDDFIVEVCESSQTLRMDLPEGLIEDAD